MKKLLIGAGVVLAIGLLANACDDEPTPATAPPAATSSAAPSTTEAASPTPTPTPSEAQDPYYVKGYEMVQSELADVTDCTRITDEAKTAADAVQTWLDRGDGTARGIALLSGKRDAAQDRAAGLGC